MVDNPKSHVTQGEGRAALEDIAHLTRRICGIWGTPELDVFLSQLLMDARGGARKGLPVAVATEVLFQVQTNKMLRAMELSKKLSLRLQEAYRMVDDGDQARLRIDPLDDPEVSRDTIISRADRSTEAPARRPAMPSAGGQAQGLGQLLLMLVRSKWLVWGIVLLLGFKLFWPAVKTLI